MGWLDDIPDGHPLHRMAAGKPPFEMTPEERAERDARRLGRSLGRAEPLTVDAVWQDAWALLSGEYVLAPFTDDVASNTRRIGSYDWTVLCAAFQAMRTPVQMLHVVRAIERAGGDPLYVITRNGLNPDLQMQLLRLINNR